MARPRPRPAPPDMVDGPPVAAQPQQQHPRRYFRRFKWNGAIAFANTDGATANIMAIDPNATPGAAAAQPRTLVSTGFNAHPAYSSDGKTLAFSSLRAGANFEVYVARAADGSNARAITNSPGANEYSMVPDWSCDDSKVAFEGTRGGELLSQAYVTNADGSPGGLAHIYSDPGNEQVGPKFSPNCKQVCFASTAGGAKDLYVIDIRVDKASNAYRFVRLRRLTRGMHNDFSRAWSPDSRKIVFNAQQVNGVGQLYIVTVRTGRLRQLTANDGAFPGFAPGGFFGATAFRGDITPKWAPDGKAVAFCRQKAMFPGDIQGTYQVYLVGVKGRREQQQPVALTNLPMQSITVGWQRVAAKPRRARK